ncbi:MAG: LLM class flavin-dependent oxidoreductase [Chloroflexi bacterium]|jgi:alkanesulfonate monooxygenase SsuD/methylene tetrahydromethanopterin reductase-like flavin-dependent oxidoreductase (luciferase family)|nr:LLM class flavin-dependent oxidoreductase [Chloroflexota bacterium]
MQFYFFHLMPYPYLKPDYMETERSAWVTYSNRYYDPQVGHQLYNRYLDELEYADELGFDGICVNEHHQNAYGLMPSPNVMAAMLARRTQRAKIAILGNALPLRDHPLRVAEEVAMLDVVTGGRIISGFVRGIGCEYHSFSMNPTHSRERFLEAHDLIIRAWTEPGPFEFYGKHYRFRYVNVWPRPLQQPHPPIWIPSQGSSETIEWAAERRYPYLQTFNTLAALRKNLGAYREAAQRYGYEASPEQLGWAVPVYVAPTDEEARREAKPHIELFYNQLLRYPPEYGFPPGYLTERSMVAVLQAKVADRQGHRTFEQMNADGYIIAGSPETVRQRLTEAQKEIGYGLLVPFLQFGSLPADLTRRNTELFAREVMPALRPLGTPTAVR